MTPNQLATFGRSLYGARWQTALAADLNVADRTMRRWMSDQNPIPQTVVAEVRELLLKRLGQIGGLIGYSIDSSTRQMLHHQTGAWFQFDDNRNIVLLNAALVDPDIVPLIRFGAEEAWRRYLERDPALAHTWVDPLGRGQSGVQIEVEYKGCEITYPHVRANSTGWTINLTSNYPHILNRLGGRTVIIKSHVSLDDAIAEAKRRVDQIA
jgi:hypothetical protein